MTYTAATHRPGHPTTYLAPIGTTTDPAAARRFSNLKAALRAIRNSAAPIDATRSVYDETGHDMIRR